MRSRVIRPYEHLYCARGKMDNQIKGQRLGLFADRTSTETRPANQVRLYFSAFTCLLLAEPTPPLAGPGPPMPKPGMR